MQYLDDLMGRFQQEEVEMCPIVTDKDIAPTCSSADSSIDDGKSVLLDNTSSEDMEPPPRKCEIENILPMI